MSQDVGEVRLSDFFVTLLDELQTCPGVNKNAKDRLVLRARKRAGFVNGDLDDKAKAKFIAINNSLKGYVHSLPSDIVSNARHFITVMLERYFTSINSANVQVAFDHSAIFDHWRFGPGASNGVRGTHFLQKIDQPMSSTALCEPLVRRLRHLDHYIRAFDSASGVDGVCIVEGSRLTTVPKNEETVRTIAIEPSGNMALQLSVGRHLENTLKSIGLDISKQQPLNKALARRGSVDGTLCTIDLSSASDMISIDLVRAVVPSSLFDILMKIRSPYIEIDGVNHELNMISTMGNGFTFPLMTLIITALVYANRCERRGPTLFIDWSSTAVFGDDIIVPSSEYASLCITLAQAGLVVNHDKSYSEGPFRESCGGDYMEGYDVTPFYVRHLRVDAEIYVAINQLLEWSSKHSFYPYKTLKLLIGYLRGRTHYVPMWSQPFQGIRTTQVERRYTCLSLLHVKNRYDGFYKMYAAIGGYADSDGPNMFYIPRPKKPRYVVRSARLPKGYLDGADYVSWSVSQASHIDFLLSMSKA